LRLRKFLACSLIYATRPSEDKKYSPSSHKKRIIFLMKKLLLSLLFLPCLLWTNSTIYTSITPYKTLIEPLVAPSHTVLSLVPKNSSMHAFEPSFKETQKLADSTLWIRLGDQFEEKIASFLLNKESHPLILNLKKELSLSSNDPHIWMDPKLMKKQIEAILTVLKDLPDIDQSTLEKESTELLTKLEQLDRYAEEKLTPLKGKTILSSHDAYGYFCTSYGLKSLSLEKEGRQLSLEELQALLQQAKKLHIDTILVQTPFQDKSAEHVAKEIGGKTLFHNPIDEDYFHMIYALIDFCTKEAR